MKKPNEAIKILQGLKVYPSPLPPPASPEQVISELRQEMIDVHTTAVELVKAPAAFAPVLRQMKTLPLSQDVRKQLNELADGIATDCKSIGKTLNGCVDAIKAMDTISDKDEYLVQSIQVHTELTDTIRLYGDVVAPQVKALNDIVQNQVMLNETKGDTDAKQP